jgi:phenylalanyl-tRNA synthetase beta chain
MVKLDEDLAFVKSEIKAYNERDGVVSVEIKDTNRPDLWSVEGLARGLRCYLNLEKGPRKYQVGESATEVNVDLQLKNIRPFIACSVIKNVHLTDTIIKGLMHLQDKLDQTHGRSRQKTSIGIYNFDLIASPLSYSVANPTDFRFTPLGFSEKMTLAEILEQHPKGKQYGHIVNKHKMYPILLDSEKKVLSFPPIINSNDLGRVTEKDTNLLVEVTGTLYQTVLNTLNLVTTALIDRGGKAFSVKVHYPKDPSYPNEQAVTPNFSDHCVELNVEYVNQVTGLKLNASRIAELLLTAGVGGKVVSENVVEVLVPCYRVDVMHPIDLVEDVAVAFGYNNIEPLWRDLPTTGNPRPAQRIVNIGRELMVGSGYQEVLNYTLTNPEKLFVKMNKEPSTTVEISNPKIITMSCLRNWLLPGLIEFLSTNQSVAFPQRIFELGKVTIPDETRETKTRDEEWLAAATTHPGAGFSEIKACLDSLFINLGFSWQLKTTSHPMFIEGRVGAVVLNGKEIGVVGEVSPIVLESWKLENPVAVFEINLQLILEPDQNES